MLKLSIFYKFSSKLQIFSFLCIKEGKHKSYLNSGEKYFPIHVVELSFHGRQSLLSMRLSPGPSPLYTSKVRKHHELENFLFTTMNNKLELAVVQIFIVSATSTPVHTKHTRHPPSPLSLALSPVPSRHFVQFLSFTTKAANRNCCHPSHKTLAYWTSEHICVVMPNACTGSGYLSQR